MKKTQNSLDALSDEIIGEDLLEVTAEHAAQVLGGGGRATSERSNPSMAMDEEQGGPETSPGTVGG